MISFWVGVIYFFYFYYGVNIARFEAKVSFFYYIKPPPQNYSLTGTTSRKTKMAWKLTAYWGQWEKHTACWGQCHINWRNYTAWWGQAVSFSHCPHQAEPFTDGHLRKYFASTPAAPRFLRKLSLCWLQIIKIKKKNLLKRVLRPKGLFFTQSWSYHDLLII